MMSMFESGAQKESLIPLGEESFGDSGGKGGREGDSRWLSEGVTCSPPYRWPPLPSSRDTKITWGTAIISSTNQ